MSLQIWLPLIKDYKNYGLSNMQFSSIDNTTTAVSNGKIGETCYQNASNTTGGFISDKTINLGKNLSMCCWVKFSSLMAGSSLGGAIGGQHRYQNYTGMGLTFKYVSATTGYLSCNTGDGSSRTYNYYCGKTLLMADNWYHVCLTYDGNTIKFYVDGKEDGVHSYSQQMNVEDFVQIFGWSFGSTSGSSVYSNYKLNGYINDFRIYNHTLSDKEIKLIAQGQILHYTMSDKDLESTTNLFIYPTKTGENSASWNAVLHPEAITVQNWTSGYNGGVSEPSIGYHAYWKIIDGISTMVFPNLNSEVGKKGRWLGISTSGQSLQTKIGPNTTYTISFDAKGSVEGMSVNTGYYYRLTGASSNNFHDGNTSVNITTQWKRYSVTFTTKSTLNTSIEAPIYFYGHYSSVEGVAYIRNVQVEIKDHATAYTPNTRISSKVYDCAGYLNDGTILGNGLIVNYDNGGRRDSCILFDGATAITCGRKAMVRDSITVNIWAYMDNWSDYNGNSQRMISCTEGGGWNFEPNSSKMSFPVGTGETSNTYKSVVGTTLIANLVSGWHMFTGTYDGFSVKIYIDGKLDGSNSVYTTKTPIYYNASNAIFIGAEAGGSITTPAGSYFKGKISDIRIFGKTLSAEEILELYQTSASITENNIIISYELNETSKEKIQIKQNGIIESGNISEINTTKDMKIKTLSDGSAWARIHWLDVNHRLNWFTDAEVQEITNQINRYSRMNMVENFKGKVFKITNLMPEINNSNYSGGTLSTTHKKYGENSIQLTGTTSVLEVSFKTVNSLPFIQGHIYYGRAEIYQETLQGSSDLYWKIAEPSLYSSQKATVTNQWNIVSNTRGASGNAASWESGNYQARYDYNNSKNTGDMWFDGLMLIDLTETFGVGHEPSASWCNKNIPYFIGTKDIKIESEENNGWYEFMLTYPSLSDTLYNRWRQTSSPNSTTVANYIPIEIAWPAHSAGIRKSTGSAVYDCDSGSTWYACIGQKAQWTNEKYIPAADGSSQTETELWVRIDTLPKESKMSFFNNKFIQAEQFQEW